MRVTLTGKNGSKLAEKSTCGDYGEPFLALDKQNIVVPFDFVDDVESIRVSFNGGQCGQIRTLIVEGISISGLEIVSNQFRNQFFMVA